MSLTPSALTYPSGRHWVCNCSESRPYWDRLLARGGGRPPQRRRLDAAAGVRGGGKRAEGRRKRADAFAASVASTVRELGFSLHRIAAELEARGIRTAVGGRWTAAAVNAVKLVLAKSSCKTMQDN